MRWSPRPRPGDRDALDALLRRHYDRIYALCRRIAGNEADALDATQEAMIAIVRGLGRFDGRAVVHHVDLPGRHERLPRRVAAPAPAGRDRACPDHETMPADDRGRPAPRHRPSPTASTSTPRSRRLPLEFRTAVVLRDVCRLDYAEIAEVLDIPPGTVRSRIARGRAALAKRLAGNPGAADGRPTPRSP